MSNHKKRPFKFPELTSIRRIGPFNLPEGGHAQEKDFLSFGIRCIKFDIGISGKEKQELLDSCYEAFCDLARILDIDREDISLGGTLSLSFGIGNQGNNNGISYDSERQVISFSRYKGRGGLAHQWVHALDHYIGYQSIAIKDRSKVFASDCQGHENIPESVKKLIASLSYRKKSLTPQKQK